MPQLDSEGRTPAARAEQAAQLRQMGATYEAIAKALGYRDKSGAYRAVKHRMEQSTTTDEWNTTVALELSRLDRMQRGLWTSATAGDVFSVDRVLKIQERRAFYQQLGTQSAAGGSQQQEDGVVNIANARAARQARAAAKHLS